MKNIYRYGFIIFILLFFYSKCFLNKKSILIYILISLSVILFDGIFQALTGYDFFKNMPGNIYSGLNGPIGNRNPFSFLMGIGLLITVFCNRNKNYLFYLLAVLFIFCILFSYSRAIWVSLFFSFVCYFIINFRSIDKKTIITLLSISVLLIVIFLNVDSLNHRFNALIDGNSSGRTNIWLSSLPFIKDQIFIGHGLNTMIDYKIWGGIYSMHNHTLEILFDLGILGLLSFVALLILILKELKFNKSKILFYLLVYFLINGIFGESIISSKLMLSTLTIFVFFVFVDRIKLTKGKLI